MRLSAERHPEFAREYGHLSLDDLSATVAAFKANADHTTQASNRYGHDTSVGYELYCLSTLYEFMAEELEEYLEERTNEANH